MDSLVPALVVSAFDVTKQKETELELQSLKTTLQRYLPFMHSCGTVRCMEQELAPPLCFAQVFDRCQGCSNVRLQCLQASQPAECQAIMYMLVCVQELSPPNMRRHNTDLEQQMSESFIKQVRLPHVAQHLSL